MAAPSPRALIQAQVVIESFALTPSGNAVVYVLRRVVDGEYHSHLWLRPWRGGPARQLTRGVVRDGSPAISPDGTTAAFVRSPVGAGDERPAQIWLLPLEGGEPWQLTALKHGAASAHWSPDGRRLAIVGQAGDHRFIVGKERSGRTPLARRITRLDYRDDESGHVVRRTHLWIVAARAGARAKQLTKGDYDVTHPAWSPDGRRIAFAADRGPDANIAPRLQIWSVPAAGGRVSELASLAGDADRPAFSPDGRRLAFIGTDVDDPPEDVPWSLWVRDLPDGQARNLTESLDRSIGEWAWADMVMAEEAPGPIWTGSDSLVVLIATEARDIPYRVTPDGGCEPVIDRATPLTAAGIAAAPGTGRLAIAGALPGGGGEVMAVEDGALRPITREGSAWLRRFPRVEITEMSLPGPAGSIHAWLASPAGAGRKRLPLVLHIHGGPTGAWGGAGSIDDLLLCGAGYRVLMPNIRGSATFGTGWSRPLAGSWGDVDAADALAAVDALVDRGLADAKRVAVMGLSYGGFLTQWLIGVTDRFAAAIAENGVTNQVSTWANSYFAVHYNRRAGLGDPLSDAGMQRLWSFSPLRNVARITTPLLILQSEEDRVCPAADNEQLFTALKVLGRETELILYPEEHHEMKNTGRPDRRIDRMERIVDWLGRHVDGGASRG